MLACMGVVMIVWMGVVMGACACGCSDSGVGRCSDRDVACVCSDHGYIDVVMAIL